MRHYRPGLPVIVTDEPAPAKPKNTSLLNPTTAGAATPDAVALAKAAAFARHRAALAASAQASAKQILPGSDTPPPLVIAPVAPVPPSAVDGAAAAAEAAYKAYLEAHKGDVAPDATTEQNAPADPVDIHTIQKTD